VSGALVVIPARLKSTRLPEKPLLRATGKYLVQHVWERALQIRRAAEVVIATDHERILAAVRAFGGRAVMTPPELASGTDRVAAAARGTRHAIVVNVQGDEPELEPGDVDALIETMEREPHVPMGTLVFPRVSDEEQRTPSVVKALVGADGFALDFRREPSPGASRHVGVYAFRAAFLQRFTAMPRSAREVERRLEQMRALDAGVRIRAVTATHAGAGIDTPEDYAAFVERQSRRSGGG
jgi:3-deoxy-D-manno-octulosonate cytidylyltransferase